ncbi:MAG: sodium:proton antiporter [Polyangiales bacterium]
MNHDVVNGIVILIGLGATAQWVAWRFKLPSILILLGVGFLAGPVFGLFLPDEILGDLTFPFVSLAAAIVLFEGGLTASIDEMRKVATPVRRLIMIGVPVTWTLLTIAAHYLLDVSVEVALLVGAILVVTGPTVVGPLVRHAKPQAHVGSILKLEGIINDPIGAILAVLVFQGIRIEQTERALSVISGGVLKAAVLSVAVGLLAAYLFVKLRQRDMLPEFLHNAVILPAALVTFAVANMIQAESGLLAVTVMGVALASQKRVSIEQSIEFTEHARVLLISALFILLTARMKLSDFTELSVGAALFVAAAIVIVRPVSVWVATIRSGLPWRERALFAAVAPRGVVAAAVSSVFGLELVDAGYEEASVLMPVTFLVIATTVLVYGFSTTPLVRALGLGQGEAKGVLILGADRFSRMLGQSLDQRGFRTILIDSDRSKIEKARLRGLEVVRGAVLHRPLLERLDLDGVGRFVALTPNDELNTLAASHFAKTFGDSEVYQLAPETDPGEPNQDFPLELLAESFALGNTYDTLAALTKSGAAITSTPLESALSTEEFHETYGLDAVPLFTISPEGSLDFVKSGRPIPGPGELVSLTP